MILQLEHISKSFGGRVLFHDVTFKLEEYDRLALVGPNGAGKTTMLNIISGEEDADEGRVLFAKGARVGYLEQEAIEMDEQPIFDEVMASQVEVLAAEKRLRMLEESLGENPTERDLAAAGRARDEFERLGGYVIEAKVRGVLFGLGFKEDDMRRMTSEFSGGWQMRIALAKLLIRNPEVLLLDAPTNHLDLETMEWLENYLKAYRGAVLVVSHDRYFLDAVCTRIWELRGKSIKTYRGNYSAYLPQREAADERQQKLHDAAVEKAAKLQDYVDRNLVRASTTKMAQSRRKQLEKLEIVEAPTTEAWELNFRFEYDIEPYDELVIMKNLSVHIGERTLIDALDYVVHRGDKLVIAGPNGAGKSTLLQVLDGKRRPSGGMVRLGSGAKPGVFTQQQARRAGRVIDAIWNQYPRFTELEVRSHLARFGYRGEEVFKDCASLSGGELARLRFAELALERPNLMFLDEPTNHLDIYMRESLTQALAAYTGTLLLVTHDRYLMQTLGCPIMYLEDGKATFYPSFAALQNRDAGKTQEQQKTEDTAKKQAYGKEQRKRRAEVRARLKKVESEIEELGAHIVELENEINDPEVLRDHLLLRDKCDELDDTRFHQQELYDEWEKLAEEQETFENEGE